MVGAKCITTRKSDYDVVGTKCITTRKSSIDFRYLKSCKLIKLFPFVRMKLFNIIGFNHNYDVPHKESDNYLTIKYSICISN